MRQIIFDTETTGLEATQGHRIIEIGAVELVNRRPTGKTFQRYLNPERAIDAGAQAVHGLSLEFLATQPTFPQIVDELVAFITGAELIIHNAPFDVGFLEHEFGRLPPPQVMLSDFCTVQDTLVLARQIHPGQRNSLDALCKRYRIDNSNRELHGALLDARLLTEVYLAMTGGQGALTLQAESGGERDSGSRREARQRVRALDIPIVRASAEELIAHEQMLDRLTKKTRVTFLYRQPPPEAG